MVKIINASGTWQLFTGDIIFDNIILIQTTLEFGL